MEHKGVVGGLPASSLYMLYGQGGTPQHLHDHLQLLRAWEWLLLEQMHSLHSCTSPPTFELFVNGLCRLQYAGQCTDAAENKVSIKVSINITRYNVNIRH